MRFQDNQVEAMVNHVLHDAGENAGEELDVVLVIVQRSAGPGPMKTTVHTVGSSMSEHDTSAALAEVLAGKDGDNKIVVSHAHHPTR